MKNRVVLSKTISALVALALVVPNGFTRQVKALDKKITGANDIKAIATEKYKNSLAKKADKLKGKQPNDSVRVVVELDGKPALDKAREKGLKSAVKSDIQSVKDSQKTVQDNVKEITGNKIRNTFGTVVNGFSIDAKVKDIDNIKKLKGVKDVKVVNVYYPDMNTAKELTEATKVWKDLGLKGEGMVVSIIDTGIDYTHKDMKLTDTSKEKLTEANIKKGGPGKFYTDKVPYGYNFADKNDEVRDTTSSMHGMHVAGIVGANGSDADIAANNGIKGVAPEAQLLAMKVFSNNPQIQGAYSDDIVAAIEESVNQGADIINMSLGSTASFQEDDDPEQVAIKKAVDAGTVVVVSAGNSQYSTAPYKQSNMTDTGLVGSPGLAKDALQVASYENTSVTLSAITLEDGKETKAGYTTSDVLPSKVLDPTKDFEIVDCGLGQASDFTGKDVKGKVALIKRGSINFVDKKKNAQGQGAVAAIIYNSEAGGDAYINMATDPSITIPGVFVTNTDGKKLADLAKNGGKVKFGTERVITPNVNAGDFSDFTSWGPTPNLDFKPQISAPGGNIFSTVNNNQYEVMSGTSMASPHVAGSEALIVEALKKANPNLKGRDLVDLAKNTTVNTATIEMDKYHTDTPYSPRRQGAGMIQTEKAINNKVTVTNDGNSYVALKQIGNEASFDLTLKNYGDKDATYDLENYGGVLTEQDQEFISTMSYDVKVDGAKVTFDKSSVTVPANGTATVKATLTVPKTVSENRFVEGFVKFNASNVPALVIPFMGYYGDWGKEQIIDKMNYDGDPIFAVSSSAVTSLGDKYMPLGVTGKDSRGDDIVDKDYIAISPNDDSLFDNFVPDLYFLRNAKNVDVELSDETGKVLGLVANDKDIRRKVYNDTDGSGKVASVYNSLAWDGKLYDPTVGVKRAVADGKYYLNIKATVDFAGAKPQDYKIPVKVDTTAPEIKLVSAVPNAAATNGVASYHITLEAKDNLAMSKEDPVVLLNGQLDQDIKNLQVNGGTYSFDANLKADSINDLSVALPDSVYNIGSNDFKINAGSSAPVLFYDDKFTKGFDSPVDTYTVEGKVNTQLKTFKIANQDVKVKDDGTFAVELKLNQGVNVIPIYAEDLSGNKLINYSTKINCDSIAPVINLASPAVNGDGLIVTNQDSITLNGTVEDNGWGYKFEINGEVALNVNVDGATGPEANKKDFSKTIAVKDGDVISLKATDTFGNITENKISVRVDKVAPALTISGVTDGGLYNKSVTPVVTADKKATLTLTLDDKAYSGAAVDAEGKHVLKAKAVDEAGNVTEASVTFEIDKTAPTLSLTGVEDGKLYNADITPAVQTEAGATVKASLDGNAYDFKAVTAEGKHVLEVTSTDKAGNQSTVKVSFEIDKTAPVFNVKNIENGATYLDNVTPSITVDDKTSAVSLLLDGKAYDGAAAIASEGDHVITGTATDKAGNKSAIEIKFTVKQSVKTDKNSDGSVNVSVRKPLDKDGSNVVTSDATNSASFAFENADAMKGGKGSFTLNVGANSINLPFAAFDPNLISNGSSVVINAKVDENSPLTKGLKAVNKVFTFEALIDGNGKQTPVHSFSNEALATITLTFSDDELKGLDRSKLAVFYYNETTKAYEEMATKVDGNKVTFNTPHFSSYIVAEKQVASNTTGTSTTTTTNSGSASGSSANTTASTGSTATTSTPAAMPKTGSVIDSNILVILGLMALAGGAVIIRRKRFN
ncbi:S8 family serine peptidase [Clostridium manihotivorum]|uniref:Peptidase S8 n=1 Tax=Clostridium manihotivorum TaxID=2320868 RepID=A0A410E0I4_9CLOT|nr:S8 family serine peptidase [Clostridium manihotivorum]QAA34825.1 peptidase S8 [Clostridium manihotivorum]